MGRARKFAVSSPGAECHATEGDSPARRVNGTGRAPAAALNGLCGSHLGAGSCAGGRGASGETPAAFYDAPPSGLALCRACERLMAKRGGWSRLLSHLFHNKRGFRAGVRSLGRLV